LRIPKLELRLITEMMMLLRLNAGKNDQRGEINGDDERRHGDGEIENEELGLFARPVLLLEKIHVRQKVEPLNRFPI
jgi:hypothetical protein